MYTASSQVLTVLGLSCSSYFVNNSSFRLIVERLACSLLLHLWLFTFWPHAGMRDILHSTECTLVRDV